MEIENENDAVNEFPTILYCFNKGLTSLKEIEISANLEFCNCSNNKLRSLEGMQNCVNLRYLYCSDNKPTSLDGLENSIKLRYLNCSDNKLTSLDGLENCVNLVEIESTGNMLELGPRLKEAEQKIRELETIVQMIEYKKKNNLEDTDRCIVCIEKERDYVYTACMHLSTCSDCTRKTEGKCPVCREESEYKRVYIP